MLCAPSTNQRLYFTIGALLRLSDATPQRSRHIGAWFCRPTPTPTRLWHYYCCYGWPAPTTTLLRYHGCCLLASSVRTCPARNHQLAWLACLVFDICDLTVATSRDRPALATPPTQRGVGLPNILLAHCSRTLLAPSSIYYETHFWWALVFLSTIFIPFQNLFSLDLGFQNFG
mgnify:CR=1 FL=1